MPKGGGLIDMIKSKSINDKKEESDGVRVCVMRFVRDYYSYDELIQDLAPSISLLQDYKNKKIDWSGYKKRYLEEMKDKKELIENLRKRSDNGKIITLLCWEKDDKFCHRRPLKELIEKSAAIINMKIGIVGSRNFPKLELVRKAIERLPKDTVIVSGGADGVDRYAIQVAQELGLKTEEYLPDFSKGYDVNQYHIRNEKIVLNSDKVIAFQFNKSKGTQSTIDFCRKYNKPCDVVII